ncbi:MAG: murein biosynthesis integral membrane protein MurJ [Clostridiaceae bacterium]|nr:murein biosynthesis integral membrane protein MurJ [Clostridiaceae bacterium]
MKRAAFLLMILSIASKILGFFREIALSTLYGTSYITDAYVVALTIPRLVLTFIVVAFTTGYIPIYSEIRERQGKIEAEKFTSNLFNLLCIFAIIGTVLGEIFTAQIVRAIAPGFNSETMKIAISFAHVIIPIMLIMPVPAVFSGYLNSNEKFFATGVNGVIINIGLISAIILGAKTNQPILLMLITLLAYIFQYVVYFPAIKSCNFKYTLTCDYKDANIKRMLSTSLPLFLTVGVNELNVIIDKNLASRVATGSVATLNYASTPYNMAAELIIISVITVVYPKMSEFASKQKNVDLLNLVEQTIILISALIAPIMLFFMMFPEEVIALFYERGAFTRVDTIAASQALLFYALSLVTYGVRYVCVRAQNSTKDMRTPFLVSLIMLVINLFGSIWLIKSMGINGLALATSISSFCGMVLMLYALKRQFGSYSLKYFLVNGLKILLGLVIMALTSYIIFNYLSSKLHNHLALIISGMVSVALYGIVLIVLRVEGFKEAKQIISRR